MSCFSVQSQYNQINHIKPRKHPHTFIRLSSQLRSTSILNRSPEPSSNQLTTSHRLRRRGNCLFHFHPRCAAPNWYRQRQCAKRRGVSDGWGPLHGGLMVTQWIETLGISQGKIETWPCLMVVGLRFQDRVLVQWGIGDITNSQDDLGVSDNRRYQDAPENWQLSKGKLWYRPA